MNWIELIIMNLKEEIIKDFKGIIKNRTIELKFLKKISKSKVYISKNTGMVFHGDIKSSKFAADYWSKEIFSNETIGSKNKFTSNTPFFGARHYYAINFLKKINIKNKTICDFGAGEGNLILKLSNYFNHKKLIAIEPSKKNCLLIKKNFNQNKKKIPLVINSTIENSIHKSKKKCDIAVLTWTLCNCSKPLDIIKSIYNLLNKDGYLLIGESSRILVPYKKPIFNYFNSKQYTGFSHPWHFSYNSLCNLLILNNFKIRYVNKFYNEDNLFIIAQKKKSFKKKFKKDNVKKIKLFFKNWLKESKNFKHFID